MGSRSTRALSTWVKKLYRSWATRSLAVGAVATVVDISIGLLCVNALVWSTRASAMVGVAIGATFTFFANRYFAFREHNPKLAKPAVKFVLATAVSMVAHGQLVVVMRDWWAVPFVPAKMVADVLVFSIGQMILLRFVVFPRAKKPPVTQPEVISLPPPNEVLTRAYAGSGHSHAER